MDAFTDLLEDDGFRTGLVLGLAGTLAVALGALVFRRVRPWAGVAFAAAAAAALADRYTFEGELVVGLAILAVGGLVTAGRHPLVRMVGAVPGAVLFAEAADWRRPDWITVAVLLVIVVGGALVADFDRVAGRTGLPPVMLAVSAFGVYFTTPDTEHAMVLVGVALAIALLGWPWSLGSLGSAGAFPAVAVVGWTVAVDGGPRPGSIIGGLACLGMLVVEPLTRRTLALARTTAPAERWADEPDLGDGRGRHSRAGGRWDGLAGVWRLSGERLRWVVVVGGLHVGVVGACSRVAGLRTSAVPALAIGAAAYAVAAAVLVLAESGTARNP